MIWTIAIRLFFCNVLLVKSTYILADDHTITRNLAPASRAAWNAAEKSRANATNPNSPNRSSSESKSQSNSSYTKSYPSSRSYSSPSTTYSMNDSRSVNVTPRSPGIAIDLRELAKQGYQHKWQQKGRQKGDAELTVTFGGKVALKFPRWQDMEFAANTPAPAMIADLSAKQLQLEEAIAANKWRIISLFTAFGEHGYPRNGKFDGSNSLQFFVLGVTEHGEVKMYKQMLEFPGPSSQRTLLGLWEVTIAQDSALAPVLASPDLDKVGLFFRRISTLENPNTYVRDVVLCASNRSEGTRSDTACESMISNLSEFWRPHKGQPPGGHNSVWLGQYSTADFVTKSPLIRQTSDLFQLMRDTNASNESPVSWQVEFLSEIAAIIPREEQTDFNSSSRRVLPAWNPISSYFFESWQQLNPDFKNPKWAKDIYENTKGASTSELSFRSRINLGENQKWREFIDRLSLILFGRLASASTDEGLRRHWALQRERRHSEMQQAKSSWRELYDSLLLASDIPLELSDQLFVPASERETRILLINFYELLFLTSVYAEADEFKPAMALGISDRGHQQQKVGPTIVNQARSTITSNSLTSNLLKRETIEKIDSWIEQLSVSTLQSAGQLPEVSVKTPSAFAFDDQLTRNPMIGDAPHLMAIARTAKKICQTYLDAGRLGVDTRAELEDLAHSFNEFTTHRLHLVEDSYALSALLLRLDLTWREHADELDDQTFYAYLVLIKQLAVLSRMQKHFLE